jgi:hypothetical protein
LSWEFSTTQLEHHPDGSLSSNQVSTHSIAHNMYPPKYHLFSVSTIFIHTCAIPFGFHNSPQSSLVDEHKKSIQFGGGGDVPITLIHKKYNFSSISVHTFAFKFQICGLPLMVSLLSWKAIQQLEL